MADLTLLRRDLWSRWKEQIAQVDPFQQAHEQGESVAYSKTPLFDLYEYTPSKFPSGGRLLGEPPVDFPNYTTYRLDGSGRPVHSLTRHVVNGIEWQGRYVYSDTEVVHVELNMNSRLPSKYQRLTLEDGLIKSFQRLIINGGATFGNNISPADAIDFYMGDSRSHFIWIEGYQYDGRRRTWASVVKQGLRIPETYSELSYSYSGDKLEKVVEHIPGKPDRTVFVAKSKVTSPELGDRLARAVAERVVDELAKASPTGPLVAVELSYRTVDNYLPIIIPCTQADEIESLVLVLSIDPSRWITLSEEDFAPDFVEFRDRLKASTNQEAGRKMVRTAAKLVSELARARLKVTDEFVAYAVDWEFEPEIKDVLKANGVSQKQIDAFDKRGWLDHA